MRHAYSTPLLAARERYASALNRRRLPRRAEYCDSDSHHLLMRYAHAIDRP